MSRTHLRGCNGEHHSITASQLGHLRPTEQTRAQKEKVSQKQREPHRL